MIKYLITLFNKFLLSIALYMCFNSFVMLLIDFTFLLMLGKCKRKCSIIGTGDRYGIAALHQILALFLMKID